MFHVSRLSQVRRVTYVRLVLQRVNRFILVHENRILSNEDLMSRIPIAAGRIRDMLRIFQNAYVNVMPIMPKVKLLLIGVIPHKVNAISFSAHIMNLSWWIIEFPPISGIVQTLQPTSYEASATFEAAENITKNRNKILTQNTDAAISSETSAKWLQALATYTLFSYTKDYSTLSADVAEAIYPIYEDLSKCIRTFITHRSSCLCRQRGRRACDDLQRERAWGQREGRMARRQHQLELEATGTEEGPSYGSGIDDTM
ncbi:hypothetical protein TNCV_2833981 [Trichonephila clavipes]|nr:hypothetical protein TNCV_2833981 [Trichonephila clavipes]